MLYYRERCRAAKSQIPLSDWPARICPPIGPLVRLLAAEPARPLLLPCALSSPLWPNPPFQLGNAFVRVHCPGPGEGGGGRQHIPAQQGESLSWEVFISRPGPQVQRFLVLQKMRNGAKYLICCNKNHRWLLLLLFR